MSDETTNSLKQILIKQNAIFLVENLPSKL